MIGKKSTSKVIVNKSGLVLTRASDVRAKKHKWLWQHRIVRGAVTVIAGEPGLGKSQLGIKLAATVSTGGKWPCGEGLAPAGDVIIIFGEDDADTTVRPRLEAAEANLDRVILIGNVNDKTTGPRPFSLIADLKRLDQALAGAEAPRLVIIDPLSAFLNPVGGDTFNPNDATQVRALMRQVDTLAKKHDVAIVFVHHLTKSSGSALARFAGSSALVAAARAAFLVVRGKPESKWHIFVPAKNNLGPDSTALQFRIRKRELLNGNEEPYVGWNRNPLPITAEEALKCATGDSDRQTRLHETDDFVRKQLKDGKQGASEVFADGKQFGFSERQLRGAANRLGVRFLPTGFGRTKKWWWELKRAA
jgi:putative DNA primase/helicase